MKNEFKRIDKDITEIVSDIPIDNIKDIYYKRYSDALKTLWINQDEDSFNKKMDELFNLMQRMSYDQRRACIGQDVKAYNDICYDLRIWLRSESLQFMGSIVSYNWLIRSIREDLKAYESTGDKYWYDEAKKTIKHITEAFEEAFWNDDAIQHMEDYITPMKDAPELTESDKQYVELISGFPKTYKALMDLKHEEKPENE